MQSILPIKETINAHQTPQTAYDALIKEQLILPDSGQAEVIAMLQNFYDYLEETRDPRKSSWFGGLFSKKDTIPARCGVYIWGDVGRGKSMLMDLFYDKVAIPKKQRVHFHAFMQDIHARIHAWRQLKPKDDLLSRVVDEIARDVQLICLDEMQVHDITDAAILSRLFTLLFKQGVLVVFTSNRPPMDLYKHGIQRDQFIPFIELIEHHLDVLKIKSDTDYRLQQLQSMEQTYIHPLGDKADEFLYDSYQLLTQCHDSEAITITVNGRRIEIEKTACGVAWLTFAELCERPLGAADYLEIAALFHTLVLQNIPQLSPEKRNEAKRFVTLIDTLYEHKVKLVCSAEAAPDALYPCGDGSFEFERTVSRLLEMQSARYMGLEHISE